MDALLATGEPVVGDFVTATTRYDFKTGRPLNAILVVACRAAGQNFRFLLGISGEHAASVGELKAGDRVSLEKSGDTILVNRIPVTRLYRKTFEGLVELAGSGWKRLTGKGPPA